MAESISDGIYLKIRRGKLKLTRGNSLKLPCTDMQIITANL